MSYPELMIGSESLDGLDLAGILEQRRIEGIPGRGIWATIIRNVPGNDEQRSFRTEGIIAAGTRKCLRQEIFRKVREVGLPPAGCAHIDAFLSCSKMPCREGSLIIFPGTLLYDAFSEEYYLPAIAVHANGSTLLLAKISDIGSENVLVAFLDQRP